MQQKRASTRVRTILAAHAIVGKSFPDVECKVKDLSETGARLVIDEAATLPNRFMLKIPKRNDTMLCELRWRSGSSAGVHFVEEARHPNELDPNDRIRDLEAEIVVLRRRIADLSERLYAYGDSERSPL